MAYDELSDQKLQALLKREERNQLLLDQEQRLREQHIHNLLFGDNTSSSTYSSTSASSYYPDASSTSTSGSIKNNSSRNSEGNCSFQYQSVEQENLTKIYRRAQIRKTNLYQKITNLDLNSNYFLDDETSQNTSSQNSDHHSQGGKAGYQKPLHNYISLQIDESVSRSSRHGSVSPRHGSVSFEIIDSDNDDSDNGDNDSDNDDRDNDNDDSDNDNGNDGNNDRKNSDRDNDDLENDMDGGNGRNSGYGRDKSFLQKRSKGIRKANDLAARHESSWPSAPPSFLHRRIRGSGTVLEILDD